MATIKGSRALPEPTDDDWKQWEADVHRAIANAVHHLGFDKLTGTPDTVIATWIMEHRDGGCLPLDEVMYEYPEKEEPR